MTTIEQKSGCQGYIVTIVNTVINNNELGAVWMNKMVSYHICYNNLVTNLLSVCLRTMVCMRLQTTAH